MLGTLIYTPWIVQQAASWRMYTTTAYDPPTGISIAATASPCSDAPPMLVVRGNMLSYDPDSRTARFMLIGLGAGDLEIEVGLADGKKVAARISRYGADR